MGKVTRSSERTQSKSDAEIWTERLGRSRTAIIRDAGCVIQMGAFNSRGIGVGPPLAGLPTSAGNPARALRAVRHRVPFEQGHFQHSTRTISKSISPTGALTRTTSPAVRPSNALPIGLSLLIRPLFGSVSVGPTIVYSSSS